MHRNRHDIWLRFCEKHRESLAGTGLPTALTRSEHRFRELLGLGIAGIGDVTNSLGEMSPAQWSALRQFTVHFFNEFESYAPLDLFPAFRREAERRESEDRS